MLRRLREMNRRADPATIGSLAVGCAIDVETSGLDHRRDVVIELAMRRFLVDEAGRILETGASFRWLEDPGFPIPPHITRLTRISDEDVRGRRINEAEATCVIVDSDFVVAHNASFDRPFVEKRLPAASGRPWICSMAAVDWRARGFEGRSLSHLLLQMDRFYDAHRADTDVLALLHLLDHRLEATGGTVLAEALETARRPSGIVEAFDAPFTAKDELKRRGYRWNAVRRVWWIELAADGIDGEVAWLEREVYAGRASPVVRSVDWTQRHGATVH